MMGAWPLIERVGLLTDKVLINYSLSIVLGYVEEMFEKW